MTSTQLLNAQPYLLDLTWMSLRSFSLLTGVSSWAGRKARLYPRIGLVGNAVDTAD